MQHTKGMQNVFGSVCVPNEMCADCVAFVSNILDAVCKLRMRDGQRPASQVCTRGVNPLLIPIKDCKK